MNIEENKGKKEHFYHNFCTLEPEALGNEKKEEGFYCLVY
jgi:hypothetical protein